MILSKRAQQVVEVLQSGGKFVRRLERSYHGGEQFHYRLMRAGYVIKGYGLKAFYELEGAGLLVRGHGSSVSEVYELRAQS